MAQAMTQAFDLAPKKWPKQARSRATFDALVEACTLVLPRLGYAGTTTNHIADAAGVGIASLYEYFPGKDAIIARVIEAMNARLLTDLAKAAFALKDLPKEQLMEAWLNAIYLCLLKEQNILRVLTQEVPYHDQVSQAQNLPERLMAFSELLEYGALDVLPKKQSKASMYLIVHLVVSSLTHLVIHPPEELETDEVISELSKRLNHWVFSP